MEGWSQPGPGSGLESQAVHRIGDEQGLAAKHVAEDILHGFRHGGKYYRQMQHHVKQLVLHHVHSARMPWGEIIHSNPAAVATVRSETSALWKLEQIWSLVQCPVTYKIPYSLDGQ